MCPADQPVQREDLPTDMVLACARRRRYIRQHTAVDFQDVSHGHAGIKLRFHVQ